MMKMCMSMGVNWIFENLPKFDNSNAIKLLKVIVYSYNVIYNEMSIRACEVGLVNISQDWRDYITVGRIHCDQMGKQHFHSSEAVIHLQ